MEHLFRIAFWICTLSGCLQAAPIPKSDFNFKEVSCASNLMPANTTFYSPTNVQKGCITTALACFRDEVDTKADCLEDLSESLTELIKERSESGHGLTNSTDCACKKSPQLTLDGFLSKMESLVDLHMSIRSSRK